MRRRIPVVAVAAAVLALLAGCAATPGPSALLPTPSSGPTFIAGVGDEVVLLNCEMFVPIAAAAEMLGVPVADVIDQQYPPAATTPYPGAVAAAMATQSVRAAGGQQCRYVLAGAEDGGPRVLVTVLPNAAAEFGRIEPDVNDGLRNLLPAELGDQAFSGCRDGEWQGCRAEVLIGTTWLSISVGTPEPDPAAFQAYASDIVDSLGALKFDQPLAPARTECDTLLSPHDVSVSGALVDASLSDGLVLDDRSNQNGAARVRGGLVDCSWSGTGGAASVTPIGYSGVALSILPGAEGLWAHSSPTALPSTITLVPVDLAGESGARWPHSGIESLGGCAGDQCQVTLMADGIWLTVTTTGPAGLAGTSALAAAAYARYVAAV